MSKGKPEKFFWEVREPGHPKPSYQRHIPNRGPETYSETSQLPEGALVQMLGGKVKQVRNGVLVDVS